jgi:hypothetical protein
MLVDPRKDDQPFYVGKGKGRRATTHLWETPETRNVHKENKIAAIRASGLEPKIIYVAENIIDEEMAYELEAALIKKYGRRGYDKGGILTNICADSRPPNHKGKTYEEIYGSKEKADRQRALRSMLQKARGGYGPKIHSKETREKISAKGKGRILGPCPEERKQKIRENRVPVRGAAHHESKRWKLTSPEGQIFEQVGNLKGLCESLGLSFATMHAAHLKNRIPKYGVAKGWKIEAHATDAAS